MLRRCASLVVVGSVVACGEPAPVIDLTTPDTVGEGEGEGENVGEGEGEGENVVTGDCAALKDATFSAPITLVVARSRHTATLLNDGRVLLVGGEDDLNLPTNAVEIVDVDAGTSVAGPPLATARYEHAAVKLGDGSVVVAGGFGNGHLASIERFDGTTWTTLGDLDAARSGISGLALNDGRAIFFGGDNTTAIPDTSVIVDGSDISVGPNVGTARRLHTALSLSDGRVVVAGGFAPPVVATSVIIAADGATTTNGPLLASGRRQAMGVGLDNGTAFIFGGIGANGVLDDVNILVGSTVAFTANTRLLAPRHSGEVLAMACGAVVCGGLDVDGAVGSCEGLTVGGLPVAMSATLPAPTFSFTFTKVTATTALMAGGSLPDGHIATAQLLVLAP